MDQLCSIIVFTTEKNPDISGPAKLKSVLSKGQLYIKNKMCKDLYKNINPRASKG